MKRTSRRAAQRGVPGGALLFQRIFTRLEFRGRPPHFLVEFYPYANLTHSIRMRQETAHVRLSDVLSGAPLEVLEATAGILLARLYHRRPPRAMLETYRRFSYSKKTRRRLEALRRQRARHRVTPDRGTHHDLEPLFEELNRRYFDGRLARPRIGWSTRPWRSQLGAFDPALQQIAINCALDRPEVPAYVIAYILYHEMLHQSHPMKFERCRLASHSPKFREEERKFEEYGRALRFLEHYS